jgi:hypothetical protein
MRICLLLIAVAIQDAAGKAVNSDTWISALVLFGLMDVIDFIRGK